MPGTRTRPRVGDVMTHVLVAVEPDATVQSVASLLAHRHISGAPVISRSGEVLGIVSVEDILRAQTETEEERRALDADPLEDVEPDSAPPLPHGVAADARPVLDIAMRRTVQIDEETPLDEAAKVMLELGLRRMLVTRGGRLAGILTATDLIKWVARPALEKEEKGSRAAAS